MKEKRYRITNIEISEDQFFRAQRLFVRGTRKIILRFLFNDLLDMLEENRAEVTSKLLSRELKLEDFMDLSGKPTDTDKKEVESGS